MNSTEHIEKAEAYVAQLEQTEVRMIRLLTLAKLHLRLAELLALEEEE